jgi:nucleotide-binding universal stress UspA family protein
MRVLLAIDGSPHASVAIDLVASMDWPADTTIRVLSVLDQDAFLWAAGLAAAPEAIQRLEDQDLAAAEGAVDVAVSAIRRPGLLAEGRVRRGRAATLIVDEAAAAEADLVVVGSRGHGTLASALLGSVSAEVVDHAPCPVLVARRGWLRRLVLADDGSPDAARARALVREWPVLRSIPACVVSVATVPIRWEPSVAPFSGPLAADRYERAVAEGRRARAEVARHAHDELAVEERPVEYDVRVGAPAMEIIAAATQWNADLIVLGSHGRTGLRRIALGSVARSVVMHAPCSVLVIRRQAVMHAADETDQARDLVVA